MYETNNPMSAMSYTNLDFQTIYAELLETAKKLSSGWDPTISNESDPGVVLLKVAAIIGDKNNYNIDKNILENYPETYTQEISARSQYRQLGYKMPWYRGATTSIRFKWDGDALNEGEYVTIPKYTMVTDRESVNVYTLLDDVVVGNTSELKDYDSVSAIQGIYNEYAIMGDKTIRLSNIDSKGRLYLEDIYTAENGVFVTQSIDGQKVAWDLVDNVETEPYGTRCFEFDVDVRTGVPYLLFPESIDSLIRDGINVAYISTSGTSGNISANTLTQFYEDSTLYKGFVGGETTSFTPSVDDIIMTNPSGTSDGADPIEVEDAAKQFKKLVTTFDTLVTLRDYNNAVRNIESVSNAVVTDRTNDIQCAYKIVERDSNSILGYTIHQTNKTSDMYGKYESKDDVLENKENVYLLSSGGFSKVSNIPEEVDISNLYYKVADPDMTAYDLKFYLLRSGGTMNSLSQYDDTFEVDDTEETKYRVDIAIGGKKSAQHNTVEIKKNIPFMLQNRYPIKIKIVPTQRLTDTQINGVALNIRDALMRVLNASQCEFGVEPDYDLIYSTILESDDRIKVLMLDDLTFTTYAVYKVDDGEFKYVPVSNFSNDASIIVCSDVADMLKKKAALVKTSNKSGLPLDGYSFISPAISPAGDKNVTTMFKLTTDTSNEEVLSGDSGNYVLYRYSSKIDAIRNEIVAKSILAGVTPLFNIDRSFEVPLNTDIVTGLSGAADTVATSLEVFPFGLGNSLSDEDASLSATYELRDNENLRFYAPSFIDGKTYGNYVRYELHLEKPVRSDQYEIYPADAECVPEDFYELGPEGYLKAQSTVYSPVSGKSPYLRLDAHLEGLSQNEYVPVVKRDNLSSSGFVTQEESYATPSVTDAEFISNLYCSVSTDEVFPVPAMCVSEPSGWGSLNTIYRRNLLNRAYIPINLIDSARRGNYAKHYFPSYKKASGVSLSNFTLRYAPAFDDNDYTIDMATTSGSWGVNWNHSMEDASYAPTTISRFAVFPETKNVSGEYTNNVIQLNSIVPSAGTTGWTDDEALVTAINEAFIEYRGDTSISTNSLDSAVVDGVTVYYPKLESIYSLIGQADVEPGYVYSQEGNVLRSYTEILTSTQLDAAGNNVYYISGFTQVVGDDTSVTKHWVIDNASDYPILYDYYEPSLTQTTASFGDVFTVGMFCKDRQKQTNIYRVGKQGSIIVDVQDLGNLDTADYTTTNSGGETVWKTSGVFDSGAEVSYEYYSTKRISDALTVFTRKFEPNNSYLTNECILFTYVEDDEDIIPQFVAGKVGNVIVNESPEGEEPYVSFRALENRPSDWDTNYSSYYWDSTAEVSGVFEGTNAYYKWRNGITTYYRHATQWSINANTEFALRAGDSIIFFWRESDDDTAPYVYDRYTHIDDEGNPVIIKANFTISSEADKSNYKIKDNLLSTNSGTVFNNEELYNTMKSMMDEKYTLSGTKSVVTRKVNSKTLTASNNRYYYVISPNVDQGKYSLLFTSSSAEGGKMSYRRVLDNDEFFIYVNNDKTGYEILSAGTLIEIEKPGGDDVVSQETSLSSIAIDTSVIANDGLIAFSDYCSSIEEGMSIKLTEQQIYSFVGGDSVQFVMDLTAVDANGNPLSLEYPEFSTDSPTEVKGFTVNYRSGDGPYASLPTILVDGYNWIGQAYLNLKMDSSTPQVLSVNKDSANNILSIPSMTINGKDTKEVVSESNDNTLYITSDVVVDKIGGQKVDISYLELSGNRKSVNLVAYKDVSNLTEYLVKSTRAPDGTFEVETTNNTGCYLARNDWKLNSELNYIIPIIIKTPNMKISLVENSEGEEISLRFLGEDTPCSGEGTHFALLPPSERENRSVWIRVDEGDSGSVFVVGKSVGASLTTTFDKYGGVTPDTIESKMKQLDTDNKFNYLLLVDDESLIEDPLEAVTAFGATHPYNKFTLPYATLKFVADPSVGVTTAASTVVVVNNR